MKDSTHLPKDPRGFRGLPVDVRGYASLFALNLFELELGLWE